MTEKVTIELLDEDGGPQSRFVDTESAIDARNRAAARAWRRGVVVGAVGASTAIGLAKWLSDRA
ncbi:hypothetical protein [Halomarina oriensis]|uniref:Uncharacterized protein n=1 Tax=Halomarina oriensis TaxID=671145 RepID=A0A6B0GLF4_9EURY|nr:hypothetical protein [Halomarina oriensis]MWG32945.1 hypothetical protein [Halomarina oriensis]